MDAKICLQCEHSFVPKASVQKFCSRNCSATYNNSHSEVRKKTRLCSSCSAVVARRQRFCDACRRTQRGYADYSVITLAMLKASQSYSAYHAKVRGHARAVYMASGRPYICENCGYSLHVDICHVKDIKDFDLETPVSEVNHIDNLIALDKRCHWEFDHGHLTMSQIKSQI